MGTVFSFAPLTTRRSLSLEPVQSRAVKLVKGLEKETSEEQLRKPKLFSLEKKRLSVDLIAFYSCLTGGCSAECWSVFSGDGTVIGHEMVPSCPGAVAFGVSLLL